MIEQFFEKLIEELGATGVLVLGLYVLLYRPLRDISKHMRNINDEIKEIISLMKEKEA